MEESKTPTPKHKELSAEDVALIRKSPFLTSLCYDLDILPEQFAAMPDNPGYDLMFERLIGVLLCYKAVKTLEARGVDL